MLVWQAKWFPTYIKDALRVYGSDRDMIAIMSILSAQNMDEILEIREFAYSLGLSHFLKPVNLQGRALLNARFLKMSPEKFKSLKEKIERFDEQYGVVWPEDANGRVYFDIRCFLNSSYNCAGMPARVCSHSRGGAYLKTHGSYVVAGFGTPNIIYMVNKENRVDMNDYFLKIMNLHHRYGMLPMYERVGVPRRPVRRNLGEGGSKRAERGEAS